MLDWLINWLNCCHDSLDGCERPWSTVLGSERQSQSGGSSEAMTSQAFGLKAPEDPEASGDDRFGAKLESVDSRKVSHLLPHEKAMLSGMRSIGSLTLQERTVAI